MDSIAETVCQSDSGLKKPNPSRPEDVGVTVEYDRVGKFRWRLFRRLGNMETALCLESLAPVTDA